MIKNASLLSDSDPTLDGSLWPSSSGIDSESPRVVCLRLRVSVLDESVLLAVDRGLGSSIETARLRILVIPSVISRFVSVNYCPTN